MPRKAPDWREFVRMAVDLPDHPKIVRLRAPAPKWTFACSMAYCGKHHTDGVFDVETVLAKAGVAAEDVSRLWDCPTSRQLWHLPGHDCPRCVQPDEGEAVVHDFLQHQRSAEEVERARDAGRVAAQARWGQEHADRMPAASDPQSDMHAGSHAKGNAEVEVEEEEEVEKESLTDADRMPIASSEGTRVQKRALPKSWVPNLKHRDYARQHGIKLEFEVDKFRAHAETNNRRVVNWDSAFRNWLVKAAEWNAAHPRFRQAAGESFTEAWS